MRQLIELFQDLPLSVLSPIPDVPVTGIASDSRQVQPGNVFVAFSGEAADGHNFIDSAVERGAAAVVGTRAMELKGVPYIQVADSRRALAYLAASWYGSPARQMTVIGVTGTDGKTTTSNLIYHILQAAGFRVGMISTVNAVIGNRVLDTGFHVTTPDALDVQRYLAEMVEAGLDYVVLEATSHGLAQHRVDACEFDLGVVTNITHEHQDYHGSYEAYRAAKGRLFTSLMETRRKAHHPPRAAILNRDDSSYDFLAGITRVLQVTYGFHPQAQVRAEEVQDDQGELEFVVQGPGFKFPARTGLSGRFNVYNCLAAVAAAVEVLGISADQAQAGLAQMRGVPGRMEQLELGQSFKAVVDFAHTPNALRSALEAARRMADQGDPPGRVIAVFGSAGLRDREKRRMMATTSLELADLTVLTAEDPRTESLDAILAEMAAGAEAAGGREGENFWRVPDRGEALRLAVSLARPGDVVISCGKGHEQSMCFGTQEFAWDDRVALQAALSERLNLPGPEMPVLPTARKT
jgi:UDP-N-acetylmuramoyl-L-alanyl-D-glutamate--2,6-diaminopimelate ligase